MSKDDLDLDVELAIKIKDEIGTILEENKVEIGTALSVLLSMFVSTALEVAGVPPHELIRMVAQGVCKAQEINDAQQESEELQWLN